MTTSALLAKHPAFREPSPALVKAAKLQMVEKGDRIFTYGASAETVYVLAEGTVRVYHDGDDIAVTVKHLLAPATFGEMEVLAGEPYLENADALTRCTLVAIPAAAFKTFVLDNGHAAAALLKDVCARFCVAARNERALLVAAPARIASFVLAHHELGRIALTNAEIADGTGLNVKSVSRTLAAWTKQKWAARRKGWLVLLDTKAIENEAGALRANFNYRLNESL